MDLTEVTASNKSPYRCFIRGKNLVSEGENVYTIGFKDGLAVLEMRTDKITDKKDNSNQCIDLTKLKKIFVITDPQTGKRYIWKHGKKIEIVPQVKTSVINCPSLLRINSTTKPPPKSEDKMIKDQARPNVIVTRPLSSDSRQDLKFQVLSLSVKKPVGSVLKGTSISTMTEPKRTVDKNLQTNNLYVRDAHTQTDCAFDNEWLVEKGFPYMNELIRFILDESDFSEVTPSRTMIDPKKLNTKEDIDKFNFYNDIRNAQNFDRSGNLPIHENVLQNNLAKVKRCCIALKAIKKSVDVPNQQQYAALHLAVLHGVNVEIVKTLISHGANLDVTDAEGNTAIHLAVEHNRYEHLEILVKTASRTRVDLNRFNFEGFTALILACLNQNLEMVKLLLAHESNPNKRDLKSGRTALFHAAERHNVEMVKLLMEYKADTKIRNYFGTSPHDAMFEVDEMPIEVKFLILGREHQKQQTKRKSDCKSENGKKTKFETTPVLMKVDSNDMIKSKKKVKE